MKFEVSSTFFLRECVYLVYNTTHLEEQQKNKIHPADKKVILSSDLHAATMAGKIIAQVVIQGVAVFSRAVISAYQQALQSQWLYTICCSKVYFNFL